MTSMELLCVWSNLIITALMTALCVTEILSECPESYWDEPSKNCAYPLISVLEHHSGTDTSDFLKVNTTCSAWHQTNSCLEQLLRLCNGDVKASQEIRMHIGRYRVYSLTCAGHSKYRHRLVDCFLPHIKPTRTCSEAFDRYFRNFVNDKQFRNACRVVSTAMKCFHEIKTDVAETCNEEAAEEYEKNYIQPLVEQTKETVMSKCAMSPPYDRYFNVAPPREQNAHCIAPALVALLFARWRYYYQFYERVNYYVH